MTLIVTEHNIKEYLINNELIVKPCFDELYFMLDLKNIIVIFSNFEQFDTTFISSKYNYNIKILDLNYSFNTSECYLLSDLTKHIRIDKLKLYKKIIDNLSRAHVTTDTSDIEVNVEDEFVSFSKNHLCLTNKEFKLCEDVKTVHIKGDKIKHITFLNCTCFKNLEKLILETPNLESFGTFYTDFKVLTRLSFENVKSEKFELVLSNFTNLNEFIWLTCDVYILGPPGISNVKCFDKEFVEFPKNVVSISCLFCYNIKTIKVGKNCKVNLSNFEIIKY